MGAEHLTPEKLLYGLSLANDLESRGETFSANLVRDLVDCARKYQPSTLSPERKQQVMDYALSLSPFPDAPLADVIEELTNGTQSES